MLFSPPVTDATGSAHTIARLPNPYGGAVDALVNYWIRRVQFEDSPEADMRPEWRLEWGGAVEALDEYLKRREVRLTRSAAFDLGLALADIVVRDPFGAGAAVRAAIEEAITVCGPASSWRGCA